MNRCYSQTLLTASRVDFEKLPTAGDCLRTDGPRHKLSSQAAARSRQTSTPADDGFSLSRSPLSVCFEQRLGNTHTHTQRCLVSLTISQVGTGHEGESNWKSSPLVFKIYFFKKKIQSANRIGQNVTNILAITELSLVKREYLLTFETL